MFKYEGFTAEGHIDGLLTYNFSGTWHSMVDRFWWMFAYVKDLRSAQADWKTDESEDWKDGDEVPKDFTVFRLRGNNKVLGCDCSFLYYSDGRIELIVDSKKCVQEEKGIINYMENLMHRRYLWQGYEECAAEYNTNFKKKTGITIEEAAQMLVNKTDGTLN